MKILVYFCIHFVQGTTTFNSDFMFVQICSEFHRITNINLKNHFYAELDRHAPRLQSLFRKRAARIGKAAEALDQLFSAYDLQVSWLHFLVFDSSTAMDYVQARISSVMSLFY